MTPWKKSAQSQNRSAEVMTMDHDHADKIFTWLLTQLNNQGIEVTNLHTMQLVRRDWKETAIVEVTLQFETSPAMSSDEYEVTGRIA